MHAQISTHNNWVERSGGDGNSCRSARYVKRLKQRFEARKTTMGEVLRGAISDWPCGGVSHIHVIFCLRPGPSLAAKDFLPKSDASEKINICCSPCVRCIFVAW